MLTQEYIAPVVIKSPQEAFYGDKCSLPLNETAGRISAEFVMCYPPGIPILAPGELITKDVIEYIEYAKDRGSTMTGPEDINIEKLNVLRGDD
jgi:arginine/lysine/ornithine decarboxylase